MQSMFIKYIDKYTREEILSSIGEYFDIIVDKLVLHMIVIVKSLVLGIIDFEYILSNINHYICIGSLILLCDIHSLYEIRNINSTVKHIIENEDIIKAKCILIVEYYTRFPVPLSYKIQNYNLTSLLGWYESNYYYKSSRCSLIVRFSCALSNFDHEEADKLLNMIKVSRLVHSDDDYKYLPLLHIGIIISNLPNIDDGRLDRILRVISDNINEDLIYSSSDIDDFVRLYPNL